MGVLIIKSVVVRALEEKHTTDGNSYIMQKSIGDSTHGDSSLVLEGKRQTVDARMSFLASS